MIVFANSYDPTCTSVGGSVAYEDSVEGVSIIDSLGNLDAA